MPCSFSVFPIVMGLSDYEKVHADLFEDYNSDVWPVANDSQLPIVVSFGFALHKIADVVRQITL